MTLNLWYGSYRLSATSTLRARSCAQNSLRGAPQYAWREHERGQTNEEERRRHASAPQEDAARLHPHLEPRTWALGDVLYDPDRAPAFLYFPTTAMVSLVHT